MRPASPEPKQRVWIVCDVEADSSLMKKFTDETSAMAYAWELLNEGFHVQLIPEGYEEEVINPPKRGRRRKSW